MTVDRSLLRDAEEALREAESLLEHANLAWDGWKVADRIAAALTAIEDEVRPAPLILSLSQMPEGWTITVDRAADGSLLATCRLRGESRMEATAAPGQPLEIR